jgi:hypothetical protein
MTDQKLIDLIGTHSPPHWDEFYRIIQKMLFGNSRINLDTVRFLLSTDGGRSIPAEVTAKEKDGTALLVGIGGTGDDEHGKDFVSAADLPIEGMRANFDKTLLDNGVPEELLDACFTRFEASTAFTGVRDSTPTGRTWDIADMIKQYGYGRLFVKGPSREDPLVRGRFNEDDMYGLISLARMLLVGWILVPHRLPTDSDIAMVDSMMTGWVLRNLSWQDKPRTGGPHSLASLFATVNKRKNGVVHQKLRRLLGHMKQLADRSEWKPNVEFREMLRNNPRFDGDRPECPETLGNILIMLRRREQPHKDEVLSEYPRAMQDMLRLQHGTANRFMNMMLDSWNHTQWLFLVEGRRNAQEADHVTFSTITGDVEDGQMAVVLSRGPDTFKHVRSGNRQTLEVAVVRNTLLDTTLVSSNREALRELAIRHGMPIKPFMNFLNHHILASLRIWELSEEGIEIPWTVAGYPEEVLFCDGHLPESLHPSPKWFAPVDWKGFVHSVMNGSINHADAPESTLSSESIIELVRRVLQAFHAEDVRVALRGLYQSFKETTDERSHLRS